MDIYLPLKKGIVSDAGALNFILSRLLEIIIKTIIVAKYGAILKNCPGKFTPHACKFICSIDTPPKIYAPTKILPGFQVANTYKARAIQPLPAVIFSCHIGA